MLFFFRTKGGSSEAKRLLIGILETERFITLELKLLSDLKIFPSQELLLVRKEMKAFRDKIIVGKLEKHEKARHESDHIKGEDHQIAGNVPEYDEMIRISSMELLVIEKKLSLFIRRRKDEQEAKSVQSRKNAKNKAMQEVQSRDPSNFTNQRRF